LYVVAQLFIIAKKVNIPAQQLRFDANLQRCRTKEGDSKLALWRKDCDQLFQSPPRWGFQVEF
jgi:hypothetical protein